MAVDGQLDCAIGEERFYLIRLQVFLFVRIATPSEGDALPPLRIEFVRRTVAAQAKMAVVEEPGRSLPAHTTAMRGCVKPRSISLDATLA
jgi:hypothetical protein